MKTAMTGRILIVFAILLGMYACAQTASLAARHPLEVTGMPLCSDCHQDGRAALDHAAGFSARHRFVAQQQGRTCAACHEESFCSDCHAHKDELKPSDKEKDSPERGLPHRGDYINQHTIDGRINPALCMKCHGRSNNERCKACHK